MSKQNLVKAFVVALLFASCNSRNSNQHVRPMADTVGFASKQFQVDSVLSRIESLQSDMLSKALHLNGCRLAICPHDDYTYVGWLYPATLRNITAKTVIIFGVAHKAKRFGLEDVLVFDTFSHWHGPAGNIAVSALREEIVAGLPEGFAVEHDSMQLFEHSVEALLPFLQHYNRDIEFVSILVPYMSYARMKHLAEALAKSLQLVMQKHKLRWGQDIALVVTTDAVHYGDEGWGDKNYAPFGADSAGYQKARERELTIMGSTLLGTVTQEKVKLFTEYTLNPNNYKEYSWTWCGRYSVPLGLLTALELTRLSAEPELTGISVGYATSIEQSHIPVADLGMGETAPANLRHWVGYAAVVYP